jgi:hypothetical protein
MASQQVEVVSGLYYLVGDAAPFRWFNAGDFGNDLLLNNDVVQVFQSAVYELNTPPVESDFFNVMDSCCQTTNGPIDPLEIYDGNDVQINQITHGDDELDIADVFVTFRRSLDPSLKHYARYWRDGNLVAEEVPNRFRGDANLPATEWVVPEETTPQSSELADHDPFVRIYARDTIAGEPGQTLYVPIRAEVAGTYPLRVLMFNLNVLALEDSPGLTKAVEFIPDPALGEPGMTTSEGAANYAAAWLNPGVSGLIGRTELGVLVVKLPEHASEEAVYRINFEHFSGSNNGLAVFPQQVGDGLVAFKDHSDSVWQDGIPDSWRLRHFGSLSNHLSHRKADADGDGHTNEQEYEAGTDPLDAGSQLRVAMGKKFDAPQNSKPVLEWPTSPGKEYVLQGISSLAEDRWSTIGVLTGTGLPARFPLSGPDQNHQFYRVHVSPGPETQ